MAAVALMLTSLVGIAAQAPSLGIKHDEQPPTIEESLKRLGIALTRPELVSALRNANPEVRWLAAQKLAQDRIGDAVPAILQALSTEKVDKVRVNMAFSLAQLGEEKGLAVLQEVCRDTNLPAYRRMDAARNLVLFLNREDETCRKALVEILQSQPDPDSLREAASLLRRFRDLSEEESQTIFHAAVGALAAPGPSLRLAAAITLGEIGNTSAIPYLQRAVAKEQSEVVRSQMLADLQKLKRNKP